MDKNQLNKVVEKIMEKLASGCSIVAIDGNSASGKTTLSTQLSKLFDCNIFHIDDYFLNPSQRTPDTPHSPTKPKIFFF